MARGRFVRSLPYPDALPLWTVHDGGRHGETSKRVLSLDIQPLRLVVDANGYVWRDYGGYYSMCPVNSGNEPMSEPLTIYEEFSSETQRLRGVLFSGIEIASRYMDTGRGDLDGWLELADRTLNELSGCDHE